MPDSLATGRPAAGLLPARIASPGRVADASASLDPVDDVLLQGDCGGALHAFDISRPLREPPELWSLSLGSCIESTPSVLEGMIWVGTRGGGVYGISDRKG